MLEDRISLHRLHSSSSLLAITVPATFSSAISLAKLGPLSTPNLIVELLKYFLIVWDIVIKGFSLIPFVQETIILLSIEKSESLSRTSLIILLGVATKIISDCGIISSSFSEAEMLLESFNSG